MLFFQKQHGDEGTKEKKINKNLKNCPKSPRFTACARGESGFNFLGSWSYSKEWVWSLGTKSMLHYFEKVKCKLSDTPGSSLPEFNVTYKFL